MAMTETLNFGTANGDTTAYVVKPENGNGKVVLIIQEWWGVNDHIKDIAQRYASEGFIAIVPDLYRGKVTKDAEEASALMHALEIEDGMDTIRNAIARASESFGVNHFGVTGYCMGGTFALRSASEVEGVSAVAAFYGDIPEEDVLKKLRVPTLFISATRDYWISTEKVGELEAAVEKYELPLESVKYDADHAFFNDTRPEVYDADAAADAWALVVRFFNDKL
ncbi:MAG: dienelactone hydrolase family protein [Acidobacteria bacterium]|nr:dienelactone hydrolase family protein [Acidobacteriota bacterium]